MKNNEIDLLAAFLSKARSYFEFGVGGSTVLAARLVQERITGIDSSPEWIDKVRSSLPEQQGLIINLKSVDIGPVGDWGTPISRDAQHKFPNYADSIAAAGDTDIDFCLVDGRFRVACFLQALSYLKPDALIAIHDYSIRPHYHVVEDFARPVAASGELTVFVRKPAIDRSALSLALAAHRYAWE